MLAALCYSVVVKKGEQNTKQQNQRLAEAF